jgi:hypothetical protein
LEFPVEFHLSIPLYVLTISGIVGKIQLGIVIAEGMSIDDISLGHQGKDREKSDCLNNISGVRLALTDGPGFSPDLHSCGPGRGGILEDFTGKTCDLVFVKVLVY